MKCTVCDSEAVTRAYENVLVGGEWKRCAYSMLECERHDGTQSWEHPPRSIIGVDGRTYTWTHEPVSETADLEC